MSRSALCICCVFACVGTELLRGEEPQEFVVGKPFQTALERPISATWDHVDLRTAVGRVSRQLKIAVLLDRRLDPSRELSLQFGDELPRGVLEKLVEPAGGKTSVVGNVVYLGPANVAARVRTLIAARWDELFDETGDVPQKRRFELTKRATFSWHDLDRPADLVARVGEQYQLEIEGLDHVPHDLWAGAVLPQVSAVDALALILVQFDLAFVWTEQARGIRIVPLPEKLAVERLHAPPRGTTAAAAISKWRETLPGLVATAEGGQVRVTGTIEQHEAIVRLVRPETARDPSITAKTKPDQLRLKRWDLRFRDNPVTALMDTLAKSPDLQLVFEYDADALKAAGIDLSRRISFEVKSATIEQLLKAAFDPLGIAFEIDARTVRLKPKSL